MNQKLEINWIGKGQRPWLGPHILLEYPKRSYHVKQRMTESDPFGNRLIKGDNLLALKALEAEFAGKVKDYLLLTGTIHAGEALHDGQRKDLIDDLENHLSRTAITKKLFSIQWELM